MAADHSAQDMAARAAARAYALHTVHSLDTSGARRRLRLSLDEPIRASLQERSPPRASFNCTARTSSLRDYDQGIDSVKRPSFLRRWLPRRRGASQHYNGTHQGSSPSKGDDLFKLPNLSIIGEASGLPDFTKSFTGRKSPVSTPAFDRGVAASKVFAAPASESWQESLSLPKSVTSTMPPRTSTIVRQPSVKAALKDPRYSSWFHSRDDDQRERRERRNRIQISLPIGPAPDIREHPYHRAGPSMTEFTSPRSVPSPHVLTHPQQSASLPHPAAYDSAAMLPGPPRESTALCSIKEDEPSTSVSTSTSTAPGKLSFSTDDSQPSDQSFSTPSHSARSSFAASLHTARSHNAAASTNTLGHVEEQHLDAFQQDAKHGARTPAYPDEHESFFDLELAEEAFEADGVYVRDTLLTALPERSYFDMDSDGEGTRASQRWRSLSLRRNRSSAGTGSRASGSLRRSYSSAIAGSSRPAAGARLQKRRSAGAAGTSSTTASASSDLWGLVKARVAGGGGR